MKALINQLSLILVIAIAICCNWYVITTKTNLIWSGISLLMFAAILRYLRNGILNSLREKSPDLDEEIEKNIKEAQKIIMSNPRRQFLYGKDYKPVDFLGHSNLEEFAGDPVFWFITIFLVVWPYFSNFYVGVSDSKDFALFSLITFSQLISAAILVRNVCQFLNK